MSRQMLACLLIGITMTIHAQEKNIDEVLVKGKTINLPYQKSNANITLITKAQILNAPAQSVEEVLAYYAGMDIRKRGANGVQTDISIRGGSFEQVLLLVNGVRINDAQTGHNSMNLPFDLSSVERIEILKGPAARRFGQGAYSGVVNIITEASSENKLILRSEAGDFGAFAGGVSSHFGGENSRNFIQINRAQSEGYRYNTDYKIHNFFYQNQVNLQNGLLKLQAGFQEKKFGANGFYASPAYKDQYEEIQMSLVSLGLEKKLSRHMAMNALAYWRRAQDMYLLNRKNPAFYRNMHIGNQVGAEVSLQHENSLGKTGFGVDARKEFLESNRLGSRERVVSQVFLEHYFSLFHESLLITPGVSWSNIEGKNYFYPGIEMRYGKGDYKTFAQWSKVNRIPTYTDLYYVSPTEVGNALLQPESAWTAELGQEYQKSNTLIKYSVFWRNSQNAIDWQKATSSSPWTAQNIGNIVTKGLELEVQHAWTSWMALSLGYTYLDNQRISTAGVSRYALDHLKHQGIAKLKNTFGGWSHELVYRYNERVNLGSYHLLDDKITYHLKHAQVYFLINNLTNTHYIETSLVPMPGRWFHVGFTYSMKL